MPDVTWNKIDTFLLHSYCTNDLVAHKYVVEPLMKALIPMLV